ncbi:dTMP kinase [Arthrobacter sp. M4]|uniref:dTMP kinase n=1 Tax=Arthrobacter sp. M4 TaxID=218160 RepID=UPI001CDD7ABB|nr:dTMP kinase [Arthrobacter sp. M4]MCA4134755.1 thymidylate kinase [Arthrobacter sp. M4]
MLIVLTGIDGSGKTTAAHALAEFARAEGRVAIVFSNHAGRRRISLIGAKLGFLLPPRLSDAVETVIRVGNVLVSHVRTCWFFRMHKAGLVVMDRHLHCQLALREMRGLPAGWLLPRFLELLPQPDVVVHLDVEPGVAHQRILARGTDEESVADLKALREAYRLLPHYAGFLKVDANGSPDEVLRKLTDAIDARGRLSFSV